MSQASRASEGSSSAHLSHQQHWEKKLATNQSPTGIKTLLKMQKQGRRITPCKYNKQALFWQVKPFSQTIKIPVVT